MQQYQTKLPLSNPTSLTATTDVVLHDLTIAYKDHTKGHRTSEYSLLAGSFLDSSILLSTINDLNHIIHYLYV